jgi:hypothetical protein
VAAQCPAAQRRHVGLGPGLVDEDQTRRVKPVLIRLPPRPAPRHIRTKLRRCEQCFLKLSWASCTIRQTEPELVTTLCSPSSTTSAGKVTFGAVSRRANIQAHCQRSLREVARTFKVSVASVVKRSQRFRSTGSAAAKPTGRRQRQLAPAATAATTRLAKIKRIESRYPSWPQPQPAS